MRNASFVSPNLDHRFLFLVFEFLFMRLSGSLFFWVWVEFLNHLVWFLGGIVCVFRLFSFGCSLYMYWIC